MHELCNKKEYNFVKHIKLFCYKKSHSKSQQELAAIFKTTPRQIRALIKHLVEDHLIAICSTPSDGVYYPNSREEADNAIYQLLSREHEIKRHREALEVAVDNLYGAPTLFDLERRR